MIILNGGFYELYSESKNVLKSRTSCKLVEVVINVVAKKGYRTCLR